MLKKSMAKYVGFFNYADTMNRNLIWRDFLLHLIFLKKYTSYLFIVTDVQYFSLWMELGTRPIILFLFSGGVVKPPHGKHVVMALTYTEQI